MKDFAGNIPRLYMIKTAKWFSLIMPIIVLFYQDNGMSMTEIFWLKSIYSLGMLVWEIPSGYLGDVWGRKKTLIAGSILTTLGFSIYCFAYGFWHLAIAEFILGIGQSFISGADSAMLFDSMKAQNREDEYLKYEGKVTSLGNFSEAIAGVAGGLLALISLRTPFVVQALFSAIAIPAAITLKEPHVSLDHRVKGFRDIINVVKYALFKDKKLRLYIFLSSIIGTATLTYAWFVQPYFIEIKLPLPIYGIMWTALNLTTGFFSMYAYKINQKIGHRSTLMFIVIAAVTGFLLTGTFISIWALPIIFGFYAMRGVATPVLKDYIHVLINSDVRATILSLRNMFIRIFFAIVGPILGWLTDNFSLRTALFSSAILFLLTSLTFAIPLFKLEKE